MCCLRLILVFLCVQVAVGSHLQEKLEDPNFSLFRLAIQSVYSAEEIGELGITGAFLPTDEAFDALPEGLIAWFFSNPSQLKALVDYHLLTTSELYTPNALIWQTIETVEGSTIAGLMVDGKVCVAGADHDLEQHRNVATITDNYGAVFTISMVLFPDGLTPCEDSTECSAGKNCRWYSEPECPEDTLLVPSKIRYDECQGLATCQSCSALGATCNKDAECCGLANCDSEGSSCCAVVGASCSSGSDCCSGASCGGSSLCCLADTEPCTHTDECCEGVCARDPANFNHRVCTTLCAAGVCGVDGNDYPGQVEASTVGVEVDCCGSCPCA